MRLLVLAALLLSSGCVATRMTTPDIQLTRVSLWNDVEVRASSDKEGRLKVEETQAGGDAASALLELINAAMTRVAP